MEELRQVPLTDAGTACDRSQTHGFGRMSTVIGQHAIEQLPLCMGSGPEYAEYSSDGRIEALEISVAGNHFVMNGISRPRARQVRLSVNPARRSIRCKVGVRSTTIKEVRLWT